MTQAEFKVKLAEEMVEERESLNSKYLYLEIDNIKQLRSLIIQFIIISSAIIGFALPVLDKHQLVRSSGLLIGGMGELLIVVLFGFYYLSKILQKENNDLKLSHDAFNKFLDQKRTAKIEFMKNMNQAGSFDKYEIANEEALAELDTKIKKPDEKKDHSLDTIFVAFFIGLVLILLSLVDLSSTYAFLFKVFNNIKR